MATISRQQITEAGLNPTLAAAAGGGDDFKNSGNEFLYVENTDGSSHTVTVSAQISETDDRQYGKLSKSDVSVAVPAGEFRLIGPFPPSAFNSSGKADITYSAATGMNVAVLTL